MTRSGHVQASGTLDVSVLLARWRSRELALAHTFRECAGASTAEIEDILDSTITALLVRPYTSEEHLFAALRKGIKMRALRLHRDRAERERILAHSAPAMYEIERDRAWQDDPERALIAREDDLIVSEFLADLTMKEREVFALYADGRARRAIATALGLSESQARALTETCERKRERFLTLYLAGRLCGYRSHTISNLLTGALSDSELALEQALAHLEHCRRCQAEHNTTSNELRNVFDRRALALLPAFGLNNAHIGILDRIQAFFDRLVHIPERFTFSRAVVAGGGGGGVRERLTEAIAGTGALAKITAGIVSVAVLAGGTLGVSRVLGPSHAHHANTRISRPSIRAGIQRTITPIVWSRPAPGSPALSPNPTRQNTPGLFGPGHVVSGQPHRPYQVSERQQHEPPGFVYLGVPTDDAHPHSIPLSVSAAAVATAGSSRLPRIPAPRSSGGPFTP